MEIKQIQTTLGPIRANLTDGTHVYISNAALPNDDFLTVNSKRVGFSIHLFLKEDGWTDKDNKSFGPGRTSLYAYRYGEMAQDATDSMKKKIVAAVIEAWTAFIADNGILLYEAELEHVTEQSRTANREVQELEDKADEAKKEYNRLTGQMAALRSKIKTERDKVKQTA
tara:strand:- start:1123 stop:1629 length:507 start_codon:yes stop_codon:yes gene_type:complete